MQSAPRVLVVDDDARIAKLLCAVLAGYGYACETAGTSAEAEAKIAREGVEVVLVDYHLTRDTGAKIVCRLRAQGHTQPCILLTGSCQTLPSAERSLFAAIVGKPVTGSALHEVIAQVLAAPLPPAVPQPASLH